MTTKEEERIIIQSAELPRLTLKLQKQVGDFIVDTLDLQASGHTIDEASDGMAYLLEEAQRLKGGKE